MFEQVIDIKDLSIGFQDGKRARILFQNLSLSCKSGEIIGLVGRNGIGKSTLLKTIAGLLTPLQGEIFIKKKNIRHFSRAELARNISYVSTEIPHVSNLTVYDLVTYGRFPYTGWMGNMSEKDTAIATESIDQVGIAHISQKPIDEISDGERQRAMIARALSQDTDIIILDEPTAFLDLPNRYAILRLLNELASEKGKTIIFSTHDLGIAIQEVDKIWMMHDRNIYTGAPEDLILNKGFFKLFENSQLEFDSKKGEIKLKRYCNKKIGLKGTGTLLFWTERALERIGYHTEEENIEKNIRIFEKEGNMIWKLKDQNSETDFTSVYDLLLYLKQ
jgi:iron complex transport system ATP-binding protein